MRRIEQKIRSQRENEIQSDYIGSLVMDELAELDEITYVRFYAVSIVVSRMLEVESLLKRDYQRNGRRKGKIDEAQYFIFFLEE